MGEGATICMKCCGRYYPSQSTAQDSDFYCSQACEVADKRDPELDKLEIDEDEDLDLDSDEDY
jgi:hypothetical protein